jgi:hypothetical protein
VSLLPPSHRAILHPAPLSHTMPSLSCLLGAYSCSYVALALCLPPSAFIYITCLSFTTRSSPSTTVAGTALRAYIKLQHRHCLCRTPHLCDIYADTGGMCPAKLAGSFGCEAQSKRAKATVSFFAHAFPANYGLCNPWSSLY